MLPFHQVHWGGGTPNAIEVLKKIILLFIFHKSVYSGLNDGILFLMSMPYIAVFLFALFFYLQKRKTQTA